MAIVIIEGFDTLADDSTDIDLQLAGWRPSLVATTAILSAVPRFAGSRYLEVQSNGNCRYTLPAPTDVITIGFAFACTALGGASGTSIFEFQTAADVLVCMLGLDSAGALRFGRGDFTTNNIVTSASSLIAANAWNYCEIELVRSATVGTVNVYLNGTLIATATGANTGATTIGVISFRGNLVTHVDDIYCDNASATAHKGDCKVETLMPTADTAQKDWSRSTGATNFSLVDEKPENVDTDYVFASVVGNKDLYDCADLGSTPLTIHAVQVEGIIRKDDATVRTGRINSKSGATTNNGTTRTLSTSYLIDRKILLVDPNTSAAWTTSAVNALQIGPEVVS